jgi:hypothetical protein
MIQALFGEIKNVFDKDFLLASFLPSLVFLAAIAATVCDVLGFDGSIRWIESFSGEQITALSGAGFLGTVVFAYIINSLRMVFLKLWTGSTRGPFAWFFRLGEQWNRTKYEAAMKAYSQSQWTEIPDRHRQRVRPFCTEANRQPKILPIELDSLKEKIEIAKRDGPLRNPATAEKFIEDNVLPVYQKYAWTDDVNVIDRELDCYLQKRLDDDQVEIRSKRFYLDRQFGTSDSIRGTALGNIVESYNAYPFFRYGMEGEIYWTHLQNYVPEAFMRRIREQKIIFDFCLTMATLGVGYGLLAFVIGPFLSSDSWYWLVIGLIAVLFSYGVYYRLAVFVATQYGDLIRASFDLFRGDMLKAFSVKLDTPITTIGQERNVWKELNQLLIYSDSPKNLTFDVIKPPQPKTQGTEPVKLTKQEGVQP